MLQEMEQVEKEEHLSETDLKARQTYKTVFARTKQCMYCNFYMWDVV